MLKRATRHPGWWALGVLALGMGGCGGSTPHLVADAGVDQAPPEVAVEVAPEVGAEVAPEVAAEVAAELAPEVAAETAPDVDPACLTIQPNATTTVHLRITADNECDVYVNGVMSGSTNSWPDPVTMDVSLFIHPGRRNVIAVRAANTSSQGGNDRGILGQLETLSDGGASLVLVTDDQWRTSKTEQTGWTELSFDDAAWPAATVIASHGDPPWGALLGTSTAKWIWSALVPVDTADKPNEEIAYARRTFYFGTDGSTIASKPACPAPLP